MRRKARSGFTLVELLVVIAIIVVLAAILFPVFAQVREKGRQTACLSNVRQIAAGLMMYIQDHDDLFPPVLGFNQGESYYYPATWMYRLQPYLRSQALFICPSSGRGNLNWLTSSDLLENYALTPTMRSTGVNVDSTQLHTAFGAAQWEGLGGYYGPWQAGGYTRVAASHGLAEIARPAETVAISDHRIFDWGVHQRRINYPAPRHITEAPRRLPSGELLPMGLVNVVFCDGHAKALKHERLFEIRPNYTRRYGAPRDVYIHFWPYE